MRIGFALMPQSHLQMGPLIVEQERTKSKSRSDSTLSSDSAHRLDWAGLPRSPSLSRTVASGISVSFISFQRYARARTVGLPAMRFRRSLKLRSFCDLVNGAKKYVLCLIHVRYTCYQIAFTGNGAVADLRPGFRAGLTRGKSERVSFTRYGA